MEGFVQAGYSGEELRALNWVRLHQQALFLLDVLCAAGKRVHKRYLSPRELDEDWSILRFPNEAPSDNDFSLWTAAITQLAPRGWIRDRLGHQTQRGHKV